MAEGKSALRPVHCGQPGRACLRGRTNSGEEFVRARVYSGERTYTHKRLRSTGPAVCRAFSSSHFRTISKVNTRRRGTPRKDAHVLTAVPLALSTYVHTSRREECSSAVRRRASPHNKRAKLSRVPARKERGSTAHLCDGRVSPFPASPIFMTLLFPIAASASPTCPMSSPSFSFSPIFLLLIVIFPVLVSVSAPFLLQQRRL